MSRALMSSRAVPATCCSRLRRILRESVDPIEPVATNIGQNAVGEQTPHGGDAVSSARDSCTNRARRNRLWSDTLSINGAERLLAQERGIGNEPRFPFGRKCRG